MEKWKTINTESIEEILSSCFSVSHRPHYDDEKTTNQQSKEVSTFNQDLTDGDCGIGS